MLASQIDLLSLAHKALVFIEMLNQKPLVRVSVQERHEEWREMKPKILGQLVHRFISPAFQVGKAMVVFLPEVLVIIPKMALKDGPTIYEDKIDLRVVSNKGQQQATADK